MRTKTSYGAAAAFLACGLFSIAACDEDAKDTRTAAEPACQVELAISTEIVVGTTLPPKTLALTFDDGPGLRTAELSSWLAARGIRAGFFVNGKMLGSGSSVLAQLVADGHVVANHTQTHRSLTGRSTGTARLPDAEVTRELEQTDALIAPYTAGRFMFRAPFGDFDGVTAAALTASPMAKYVGSIGWEIGDHMGPAQAADWDCWIPGADGVVMTTEQCGALYVQEIEAVGRGIVLLHDPYFIGDDPARGGTVDMVKAIVPLLEAKGYSFARIDEVPAIAAVLPPLPPGPADAGEPDATAPRAPLADAGESARALPPGDAGTNDDPCAPARGALSRAGRAASAATPAGTTETPHSGR